MADDKTMTQARPAPNTRALSLAAGVLLALTSAGVPAWAQRAPDDNAKPLPAGQIKGLTPVDAGRPDMSPFSLSFRRLQIDLRSPLGFDQVYQIDPAPPLLGAAGRPTAAPRFARRSGALTAVFPRSEYQSTEDGVKVIVPADTRFYIGRMPGDLGPEAPAAAAPINPSWHAAGNVASMVADHRADRSVQRSAPGPQAATPLAAAPAAQAAGREGMMTSESYRTKRLRALLDEAVHAADPDSKP